MWTASANNFYFERICTLGSLKYHKYICTCGIFLDSKNWRILKYMKYPRSTIGLTTSAVVLLILVLTTDPTRLPSITLIVPFILLAIILWSSSFLILRSVGLSRARSIRLGLVIAGLPVGLLILQSIGQLTLRDVIVIFTFFGIAYFYIARLTAKPTE